MRNILVRFRGHKPHALLHMYMCIYRHYSICIFDDCFCCCDFFSEENLGISLDSTVLTVNWYPPIGQSVDFYTFNCSVNDQEVVSVDTTIRSLLLGVYEPDATYLCNVWYTTTSGDTGLAFSESVTTGGEHIYTCTCICDQIWENPTFILHIPSKMEFLRICNV